MRPAITWGLVAASVVAVGFAGFRTIARTEREEPAAVSDHATDALSRDVAAPGQSGMHVSIDPETGELVVPPAQPLKGRAFESQAEHEARTEHELQAEHELQEMLSRSIEGLYEEVLPDGTVKVNLQGRFQNAAIAVIDDDGNLHTTCTEHHDGAQAALQGAACRHTTLEEK